MKARQRSAPTKLDPSAGAQPKRRVPVVSLALMAAAIGVFIMQITSKGSVAEKLQLDPALLKSEPWRVFSYAAAHKSVPHLLLNMTSVVTLGMPVEKELGATKFSLLSLASCAASAAAAASLQSQRPTVGMSGMIMGWAGAALALLPAERRGRLLRSLIPTAVISLLPGVSWSAHVGGFASGIPIGLAFAKAGHGLGRSSPAEPEANPIDLSPGPDGSRPALPNESL